MGMTITEKILAVHAGKEKVRPGEIVQVRPDLLMTNDISGPIAVDVFKSMGAARVFDPEKVVIVLDHFTPNKDVKAAKSSTKMREFARSQGIVHFYDAGFGIEHVVLPELGLVRPGDLVIGGDSHTVTYGALGAFATGVGSTDLAGAMALGEIWLKVPETIRFEFTGKPSRWIGGKDLILLAIGRIGVSGALYCAMEFGGEAIANLGMDGRFTMCNMAIEAGAKAGIVEPDEKTLAWLNGIRDDISSQTIGLLHSDEDCAYKSVIRFDVSDLEPQVAVPHLPSNVRPVSELKDVEIHQVVIGSCTNGRISDLRAAAEILRGRKVNKWVRTLIVPGSQRVYRQALQEGLVDVFIDSGAIVAAPTCGPCFGGHTGVLDEGERCVSTTNRNFLGRMGHEKSEVYLSGPYVAAASAIAGRIAHPEEV
ncbi:MAG: 3-isopropylmalate dehydratase large subunit [Candidatus Fermentithermobacillus carboniphilus]|uniref:3-isopropylmalate dehydratase large subunit n=1 Tax=Candidatus Fermentithermobacillus carboniphilus TaxID=3085328 RepID=A0AAT9LDR1_9FIRM|nr:MAG: 3-isopropylmalate dehydratase large subunit [Candidatus Fermentithermobacillus carboniphilus]